MRTVIASLVLALTFISFGHAQDSRQIIMQSIFAIMNRVAQQQAQRQYESAQVAADPESSPDVRRAIQAWLVWTRHYPGPIDGDLGERSRASIKKFQAEIGQPETGSLTIDQIDQLSKRALRLIQEVGYQSVLDAATGIQIGIPTSLTPNKSAHVRGTDFSSQDGRIQIGLRFVTTSNPIRDVFDRVRSAAGTTKIEYAAIRDNWFAISGGNKEKVFYLRFFERGGSLSGFFAVYDRALMDSVSASLSVAALTFQPFAAEPEARIRSLTNPSILLEPFEKVASRPSGPAQISLGELWTHNGSTVRLLKNGSDHRLIYENPRPDLLAAGVKKGTVLFSGRYSDQGFAGSAYTFTRGCLAVAYNVTGPAPASDKIELTGAAPVRKASDCKIVGYSSQHPDAQLIFTSVGRASGRPDQRSAAAPSSPPVSGPAQEVRTRIASIRETLRQYNEVSDSERRLLLKEINDMLADAERQRPDFAVVLLDRVESHLAKLKQLTASR